MRKLLFLFFLISTLLAGCSKKEEVSLKKIETKSDSIDKEDIKKKLIVDISGEVKKVGIYKLDYGARLYEAIEKAGGLTEKADASSINQARKLKDGEKILVLKKGDTSIAKSSKVNINLATKEELEKIRGIGPAKALDIINYRKKNGPFVDIKDIMKVNGIKNSFFKKIKDNITV